MRNFSDENCMGIHMFPSASSVVWMIFLSSKATKKSNRLEKERIKGKVTAG